MAGNKEKILATNWTAITDTAYSQIISSLYLSLSLCEVADPYFNEFLLQIYQGSTNLIKQTENNHMMEPESQIQNKYALKIINEIFGGINLWYKTYTLIVLSTINSERFHQFNWHHHSAKWRTANQVTSLILLAIKIWQTQIITCQDLRGPSRTKMFSRIHQSKIC